MQLLDSRRLTGPSLMHDTPAVIAEVAFDPAEEPARALAVWRTELERIFSALGWGAPETRVREHRGGAALVFVAPIDLLMPATDVNELAIASAASILSGAEPLALEPKLSEINLAIRAARDPALLALESAARARSIPFLLDDGALTLGMAQKSRTYPRGQDKLLPSPPDIPWDSLGSIPVALVTGTNGKTTSTRLTARIARHAGLIAGSTSTDGVAVDGRLVEAGDYTGPAGALAVLRHPEVQVAILETARGGILRRGLAVGACEAALITNVSSDHLGDYGIDDLESMARVKAVVATVARRAVLNAEDASLIALAPELRAEKIWFALSEKVARAQSGAEAWFVAGGQLTRARGSSVEAIVAVDDIPITFRGLAAYNVENALAAAALASCLGMNDAAIAAGLKSFQSSAADNPGRGNLATLPGGARVLVDFGHNPVGIARVLSFARALAGDAAISVVSGMPGDRPNEEIEDVARQIAAARPRRIILRELEGYLRGRAEGEIPALLERSMVAAGISAETISRAANECAALERALEGTAPGELIAILPSIEGEDVKTMLDARGATWA